jgi:hypothetical protein
LRLEVKEELKDTKNLENQKNLKNKGLEESDIKNNIIYFYI